MAESYFTPFLLLTSRLVLVPTPTAITQERYVHMYGDLHADPAFCLMAFGPDFPLRHLDQKGKVDMIQREVTSSWRVRGMGDMAVGLRRRLRRDGTDADADADADADSVAGSMKHDDERLGRLISSGDQDGHEVRLVQGPEYEELVGREAMSPTSASSSPSLSSSSSSSSFWESIDWIGYCGIRDATTLSLPSVRAGRPLPPGLPPWQEMIEVRYGFVSRVWGKGFGTEALHATMVWGKMEKGVKRYIAETERANRGSARILKKSGFAEGGTKYFEDPSLVEWIRVV